MAAAASVIQSVANKMAPKIVTHPTIASFRNLRRTIQPQVSIGFVPTMGALHDGHLSLVEEARKHNDLVVVSIFVNPTQFGQGEDFDKYPRQIEDDTTMLSKLGVDHLLTPITTDMYKKNHMTYVDPSLGGYEDILEEGKSRPGHFRGVATIVTKLFNIVQPTNAYFGQKDAAQCCLIKRVVEDLDMDVNVNIMDTVRERDGLAMSSRNAYLTPEERKVAPIVYRSLLAAKDFYQEELIQNNSSSNDLSISSKRLIGKVREVLNSEPLVSSIQYISVDSKSTMYPIDDVNRHHGAIISLACKVGSVRLIDNIIL